MCTTLCILVFLSFPSSHEPVSVARPRIVADLGWKYNECCFLQIEWKNREKIPVIYLDEDGHDDINSFYVFGLYTRSLMDARLEDLSPRAGDLFVARKSPACRRIFASFNDRWLTWKIWPAYVVYFYFHVTNLRLPLPSSRHWWNQRMRELLYVSAYT